MRSVAKGRMVFSLTQGSNHSWVFLPSDPHANLGKRVQGYKEAGTRQEDYFM